MRRWFCGVALALLLSASAAGQYNLSFENAPEPCGWRSAVAKEGRDPVVAVVRDTVKSGEQALLLAAQDPADVVAIQDLHLAANCVYRVSAWVRTKDVVARDYTHTTGTVQVRAADNRVLAGSPACCGTRDWHEVQFVFRSPAKEQVSLFLCLVSSGKGTGSAWFDDIRIEPVPETALTIDLPASGQNQCVLHFPMRWAKGEPYTKFMPADGDLRHHGAWSCGQVSHAMILRYWSMKAPLCVQGTYWYRRPQDGRMIRADYNAPIPWDQMPHSLRGLDYNDPRVDNVARFAFLVSAAARTHFAYEDDEGWHRERGYRETLPRYFGIDPAEYQRLPIGAYLATHTWADLYARINHDIDREMPCELVLYGPGLVHEVVITGYRKVADRYEYAIHFNGEKYDPNKFFRIDQPIGGWTDFPGWLISWGIKPYADRHCVALYNKIAELPGTIDWWETASIAWSGQEYGILVPMGPIGSRKFLFHRQTREGLPTGRVINLPDRGHPACPRLVWAGRRYAVAWSDGADDKAGIYFAHLDASGQSLSDPVLIRPGGGSPALAFCGDGYGLAFCVGRDVKFMRLDKDGRPVANSETHLGRRGWPDITWTGSVYAAAWVDRAAVQLALIRPDGKMVGDVRRMHVPQTGRCEEAQVAWSGKGYGLAWIKEVAPGHRLVCFARADKEGSFLPDSQVVVSDLPLKARNTTLDYAAGRYVLTYRHSGGAYDGYVSLLDSDGRLLETRSLFHSPEVVCHAIGDRQLNMIGIRYYGDDGALETESCIMNLDGHSRLNNDQ